MKITALLKHYKPEHFIEELKDVDLNIDYEIWFNEHDEVEVRIPLTDSNIKFLKEYIRIDEDLNDYDYLILF